MAETYIELTNKVRAWSNRDSAALPDSVITDGLQWAADKAYRTLRVPPLEQIVTYTNSDFRVTYRNTEGADVPFMSGTEYSTVELAQAALDAAVAAGTLTQDESNSATVEGTLDRATSNSSNRFASVTSIAVPGDLIEFIQIREIDSNGRSTRVFNEKADIRTFRDLSAEVYNPSAFWTREAGNILFTPGFNNIGGNYGDTGVGASNSIELYYYRRLPALDATFADTEENQAAGRVGNLVPNWFREENERIVLFGALAECFAYLQEDDQAQKYATLFYQEISELNDEDVRRNASGGNIQINYNGRGLL